MATRKSTSGSKGERKVNKVMKEHKEGKLKLYCSGRGGQCIGSKLTH